MKRIEIIKNFIVNDFNRIINDSVNEILKKEVDYTSISNEILALSTVCKGKPINIFFNRIKKKEVYPEWPALAINCDYSEEKEGFITKRNFISFENTNHQFAYIKDDILYLATVGCYETLFFPCKSGIPDSNCLKNFESEIDFCFLEDQTIVFDLVNNEMSLICKNRNNENCQKYDFQMISRQPESYGLNSLKNLIDNIGPNEINLHYAANNTDEIKKVLENQNFYDFIKEKIRKLKFFIPEYESETLDIIKNYINQHINYDEIINKLNQYQGEDNFLHACFELLPDKNILVVAKQRTCDTPERIFLITPENYIQIFRTKRLITKIVYVNSKEEIADIFNNSSVSHFHFPDIFGLNPEHPEKKLCDILSIENLLYDEITPYSCITAFTENHFLTDMLENYGVSPVRMYLKCIIRNCFICPNIIKDLYIKHRQRFSYYVEKMQKNDNLMKNIITLERIILQQPDVGLDFAKLDKIIEWMSQNQDCYVLDEFNLLLQSKSDYCLTDKISFIEYADYIKTCIDNQCIDEYSVCDLYSNYIGFCLNKGYDLNDKKILFPSELKKQHRIMFCKCKQKTEL